MASLDDLFERTDRIVVTADDQTTEQILTRCIGHPCLPRSAYLECAVLQDLGEESVKGLRFERIGKNRYYNVVFHMGNSYVPVSDETLEELKAQSLLPVERFLDFLIDRVGYSSYLKEQIRAELKASGDPVTQITVLQGAIREL